MVLVMLVHIHLSCNFFTLFCKLHRCNEHADLKTRCSSELIAVTRIMCLTELCKLAAEFSSGFYILFL